MENLNNFNYRYPLDTPTGKKDVIVSFSSNGREPYNKYLLRLIDSCVDLWPGDMLVYSPDHEFDEYRGVTIRKGWPKPYLIHGHTHAEMPYQFKVAMIQLALEKGYERIIWLDSSMQLKKDLTPLFDGLSGVTMFHNLGHDTYKYLSDDAAGKLFIDDHELRSIPQVWGGAFALDFSKEKCNLFFETLKDYSLNGSFKDGGSRRPSFVAHRHDQAVMSVLFHRITGGYDMLPYGHILCPPHDRTGEYGTDPYLVCRGL